MIFNLVFDLIGIRDIITKNIVEVNEAVGINAGEFDPTLCGSLRTISAITVTLGLPIIAPSEEITTLHAMPTEKLREKRP